MENANILWEGGPEKSKPIVAHLAVSCRVGPACRTSLRLLAGLGLATGRRAVLFNLLLDFLELGVLAQADKRDPVFLTHTWLRSTHHHRVGLLVDLNFLLRLLSIHIVLGQLAT